MSKDFLSGFFNNIYKNFFLRDFLSIYCCGLIIILPFLLNDVKYLNLIKDFKDLSVLIVILSIFLPYVLGLIVNTIRDFFTIIVPGLPSKGINNLRYFCTKAVPDYVRKIFKKPKNLKNKAELDNKQLLASFYESQSKFYLNADEELKLKVERKVVLFQTVGNFSISLLAISIIVNNNSSFNFQFPILETSVILCVAFLLYIYLFKCYKKFIETYTPLLKDKKD